MWARSFLSRRIGVTGLAGRRAALELGGRDSFRVRGYQQLRLVYTATQMYSLRVLVSFYD